MLKSSFKYLLIAFLFLLNIGLSGVIDHYIKITQIFLYVTEKISGKLNIMSDFWASWIVIVSFGLIITFIYEKIGLNNWLFDKIWNKKSKFLKQDDIELITNNLLQNLSSYKAFYNYYTTDFRPNNQYFANLHPYMEEILLTLEANTYLQSIIDIKMLDNSISSKLTAFYKKAQIHLCKLKDWLEYSKTKNLKYYQQFGVSHSTTIEDIKSKISTVDIYHDFNNYVDYDYVPKIKKLIEEVRELINILRSKHSA